jgi:hypothetical protein
MSELAAHLVDRVLPHVPIRQWTPHHLSSDNFPAPLGVVERAAREHGDEDPERAVCHSSESPSVSMALAPQAVVVTTTVRIILNTGAFPVIEGVRSLSTRMRQRGHEFSGAPPGSLASSGG